MSPFERAYMIGTLLCFIATVALSTISLINSCSAKKNTKNLKERMELVTVSLYAKKDGKKGLELSSIYYNQIKSASTLKLSAMIVIINENTYRHVVVKEIVPTLIDNSEPSELQIKIVEGETESDNLTLPFPISPGGMKRIYIVIYWPIDKKIESFVEKLMKDHKPLTYPTFSRELDFNLDAKDGTTPKKIYIKLRTIPSISKGKEIKTTIGLY